MTEQTVGLSRETLLIAAEKLEIVYQELKDIISSLPQKQKKELEKRIEKRQRKVQ